MALVAGVLLAGAAPILGQQDQDYEVGPSDLLRIVVLGQPEMSGDFTVEADGLLNFPLLGTFKASEMTAKGLEKKLTALLADGYLRRPQVSVIVKEYRSQRVFVTGEVQRGGPIALKGDRSLFGLLAEIGGLGSDLDREIIVTRAPRSPTQARLAEMLPEAALGRGDPPPQPVSAPEVIRVSLRDLQSSAVGKNLILRSGDTIRVPPVPKVYVSGHVARPGPYPYHEGITVLQVLNVAGGPTERGSSGRVRVMRIVDGKKVESKAQLTDVLHPEDMLVVPERLF